MSSATKLQNQNRLLTLLSLLFLVISLLLGLQLVKQRQLISKKAGGCGLCLFGVTWANVGQTFPLTLVFSGPLQTPNNKGITGIKAVISYPSDSFFVDPSSVNTITGLFPSPWTYTAPTVTSSLGTSYLTIEAYYNQTGSTGYQINSNSTFAVMHFIALSPGTPTFTLDATQSHVYAKNANEDLLPSIITSPVSTTINVKEIPPFNVTVSPESITTSLGSTNSIISSQVIDLNGIAIESGIDYQWSIAPIDTDFIGNIVPNQNTNIATFTPPNQGSTGNGIIILTAYQLSTGYAAVKQIPVTILSPDVTPTPTPISLIPTNNSIDWSTSRAYIRADNFYIKANGQIYLGKPDPGTTMTIGPEGPVFPITYPYRTLEMTWTERNTPMRLFIYFQRYDNNWSVYDMRTYDGQTPGDWIYYSPVFGAGTDQEFTTPQNDDMSIFPVNQTNDTLGSVNWRNLHLKAFIDYYSAPTPTKSPPPTLTPTPTPPQSITVRFFLQSVGKNPTFQSPPVTLQIKTASQVISTLSDTARYIGSVDFNQTPLGLGELAVFESQFTPPTPITPGTYSFFLKSPSRLQKNIGDYSLALGDNLIPIDWIIKPIILIPGDFSGNNQLDIKDFTDFISNWISEPTLVDANNQAYDVNFDGKLSIYDISLVLARWTSNIVYGDN